MRAHLSPDEIVTAVDGALVGEAARHLATCASCMQSVTETKNGLLHLRRDVVAEPPAAFWAEFADRVRTATEAKPGPVRRQRRIGLAGAIAALAAAVMLIVGWWTVRSTRDVEPALARDPSWQLMADVAATMTAEDIRQATAASSDSTALIGELSTGERQAFVELLTREMGEPQ